MEHLILIKAQIVTWEATLVDFVKLGHQSVQCLADRCLLILLLVKLAKLCRVACLPEVD